MGIIVKRIRKDLNCFTVPSTVTVFTMHDWVLTPVLVSDRSFWSIICLPPLGEYVNEILFFEYDHSRRHSV
jgi:hypothetical protein